MRRRALAATLFGASRVSRAADLTGIWFAEYGDDAELVQEVSQRLEGGRWRAEIWIYRNCRQTERFMLEGRWAAEGEVLTHIVQRRGNYFVAPRVMTFDVLEFSGDRMRLRANGETLETERVARGFRPSTPACGQRQRG